jgi:hypothetical protein
MFIEINALLIVAMIVTFFVFVATTIWDVSYATTARSVTPIEQQVHSFLEMIQLMAILCVVSMIGARLDF